MSKKSKEDKSKKKVKAKEKEVKPVVKKPVTKPTKSTIAKPTTPKPRTIQKAKTPKELATEKGEPWVSVVSMQIDADNPSDGSFELDFNDIFVAKLIRAGYKGKTDHDIVDQWFTAICRNVVQENYEQWEADPEHRKD